MRWSTRFGSARRPSLGWYQTTTGGALAFDKAARVGAEAETAREIKKLHGQLNNENGFFRQEAKQMSARPCFIGLVSHCRFTDNLRCRPCRPALCRATGQRLRRHREDQACIEALCSASHNCVR